jgi:hypothetical protein
MRQKVIKKLSDGTEKVYEYVENSEYYKKRIETKGRHVCEFCGASMLNIPQVILKHKESKRCKMYIENIINKNNNVELTENKKTNNI